MKEPRQIAELLGNNPYPGRGILMGLAEDGLTAVLAYFIMGRSVNSRNRVFVMEGGNLQILPFDRGQVSDARLILYRPAARVGDRLVLTNGDQTDTIAEGFAEGLSFEEALKTRRHEPDAPHFTPRVSGCMNLSENSFELSILRAADTAGKACDRLFFGYPMQKGRGRLIHTYLGDGNPLPSFEGEPLAVSLPADIKAFADSAWAALNPENRVALYVCGINLHTGASSPFIFNRHGQEGEKHA